MSMTLRQAIQLVKDEGAMVQTNAFDPESTMQALEDMPTNDPFWDTEVVYIEDSIIAINPDGYMQSGEPLYRVIRPSANEEDSHDQ